MWATKWLAAGRQMARYKSRSKTASMTLWQVLGRDCQAENRSNIVRNAELLSPQSVGKYFRVCGRAMRVSPIVTASRGSVALTGVEAKTANYADRNIAQWRCTFEALAILNFPVSCQGVSS
jgi:hypothetical protein